MILPVGEWKRNESFYRKIDDSLLLAHHQAAKESWFNVLMSEGNSVASREYHLDTLEFYQHIIDLTEKIMRERNLIQ